jgi:hypothetical protein
VKRRQIARPVTGVQVVVVVFELLGCSVFTYHVSGCQICTSVAVHISGCWTCSKCHMCCVCHTNMGALSAVSATYATQYIWLPKVQGLWDPLSMGAVHAGRS